MVIVTIKNEITTFELKGIHKL